MTNEDMSAISHGRHVGRHKPRRCLLCRTADMVSVARQTNLLHDTLHQSGKGLDPKQKGLDPKQFNISVNIYLIHTTMYVQSIWRHKGSTVGMQGLERAEGAEES